MANQTEIKERIVATISTRKITQSLELVAASKMKGFVKKALASRNYATSLLKLLKHLETEFKEFKFGEIREEGKTVFVLTTSDKGLCGSLNQRLIKYLFSSEKWLSLKKEDRILITIGKKGKEAALRSGAEVFKAYEALGENMTPLDMLAIIEEILELWEDKTAKEIVLVSPSYTNAFIQKPEMHSYLPFQADTGSENWDDELSDVTIEPNLESVTEEAAFQIILALFTRSFYELKASEYSSRMVAMKKASDSALEMISSLTLEYNKARQSKITAQVSELATAGEAMAEETQEIINKE